MDVLVVLGIVVGWYVIGVLGSILVFRFWREYDVDVSDVCFGLVWALGGPIVLIASVLMIAMKLIARTVFRFFPANKVVWRRK